MLASKTHKVTAVQAMSLSIDACTIDDLPEMLQLLDADAKLRHSTNPVLWAYDENTRSRIETNLRLVLEDNNPRIREYWLLAKDDGRPVGITRAIIVPVPPIYQVETAPGLMLDECYAVADAPAGTIQSLLESTQGALREAGCGAFISSCCAGSPWRQVLEENGYAPVTLFMSKDGFQNNEILSPMDVAADDDIAGIIARSTEHRQNLSEANPVFWNIHPDADSIFEKWMRISLTLEDRTMLVARNNEVIDGYAIAQPVTAVQMPMTHDPSGIGAIDDFYHRDFGDRSRLMNEGSGATELLKAAEGAFEQRGVRAALVVCPDNWRSKKTFLINNGYTTAKTWMLKH